METKNFAKELFFKLSEKHSDKIVPDPITIISIYDSDEDKPHAFRNPSTSSDINIGLYANSLFIKLHQDFDGISNFEKEVLGIR